MGYDVDEHEILPSEIDRPKGQRLTKFNCTRCGKPLSEEALSAIRWAQAPCAHYACVVRKEG